jgi:hypothetical protein
MSRKITLNVGPIAEGSFFSETLRYVMEQARDGDEITVNAGRDSLIETIAGGDGSDVRTQPNEQSAQKVGDAALAHLEEHNKTQDREPAASDAATRAGIIVKARAVLKKVREEGFKACIKWSVDRILNADWKKRIEDAEFIKNILG